MKELNFLCKTTSAPAASLESLLNPNPMSAKKPAYSAVFSTKIQLTALKREDFKHRPEILEKYFRHNCRPLDRFHIPSISAKEYAELAKGATKATNRSLETATEYYVRKIQIEMVAKDLGVKAKLIDLTDYTWDERWYVCYSLLENMDVVDNWFRDHEEPEPVYKFSDNVQQGVIDTQTFDYLFQLCIIAIKQRKAMLLGKVDKCLAFLMNVLEYTCGLSQNATRPMVNTLQSYKIYFKTLLEDVEMKAFLKETDDIKVFGHDERTHTDYVRFYRDIGIKLVRGTDQDLKNLSWLYEAVEDPYLDEIFEEIPELVFGAGSFQYDKVSE